MSKRRTAVPKRRKKKHTIHPDNPHHQNIRPQLLTCFQFAKAIGVSTSAMRRKMARREVAVVRVGERSVRIPESEIARIMERMIPAKE